MAMKDLCVLAILQLFVSDAESVNLVGTTHGILYIIYLVAAWTLARRLRMRLGPTVLMLLAGTIPVLTFIVERRVSHRYLEPAMSPGQSPAAQPLEHTDRS